ncbi:MAG: ShlB/FhaC/HecB family hemolysin secretion/activation protein [Hyphomonas sp.]
MSGTEPAKVSCRPDGEDCFVLLGVTILGATAISPDALSGTYEDQLATPVAMSDIVAIADRITQKYRDEGYFLSQAVVTPDSFDSGLAVVTVIEGRISHVSLSGKHSELARPIIANIEKAEIAFLPEIDRLLSRIRDIPGLSVTSRIRPDPEDPSLHELVLETSFDETRGFAVLNNRGSDQVGPLQTYVGYAWNSLLASRDELQLGLFTTPQDPADFIQANVSYRYQFQGGDSLQVGAGSSLSQDGYNPQTPEVGGESFALWMKYEKPIIRTRTRSLWINAGVDSQHLENDWVSGGGYQDELRVARVALRGMQSDSNSKTYIFVEVSSGLNILGASQEKAFNRSRFDADAEFTKVFVSASYYHNIGQYLGAYMEMSGQLADDALLLSEEYAAGGPRLGRAYRFGEISGDNGLGGLFELRAGFSPDSEIITFAQGYAFYDAASVWNDAPVSVMRQDLSSAGLGLRFNLMDKYSAALEMAKPLSRTPYDAADKDWRQFFELSLAF